MALTDPLEFKGAAGFGFITTTWSPGVKAAAWVDLFAGGPSKHWRMYWVNW